MNQEQTQQLKKTLNEDYFEREEQIDSIIDAFNNRVNTWLYGVPGTGKTALLKAVAKGLGYSVHILPELTFLHWYLESSITLDKSREFFGISANIPAVIYIHHPYMLQEHSAIIKMFLDTQHERPHLFSFNLVIGESLWEIHDKRTNWLIDYFECQIHFENIKNKDNLRKLMMKQI